MKTTLTLKGLDIYLEKIQKAGNNIDEATDRALLAGAEIIQAEMKRLAPVDTGNLRDHINIKGPIQDGHYHSVQVGIIHDAKYTDKKTSIYASVREHAFTTEFGSATKSAHPYIRPGFDQSKKKARAAMIASLKKDGIVVS